MERFAWLSTQKRWIQQWKGCEKVKWIFEGFASFDIDERDQTLLFDTTLALPHPAQLALRVGLVMEGRQQQQQEDFCSGMEKLLLSFDNSNPFVLEIPQVKSISVRSEDTACCSCQIKAVSKKEICEPIQACDCKNVPGHISLKLQHVTLNLYAGLQFSETCRSTISLPQLMEVLNKLFLEQQHLCLIDKNAGQVEENCVEQVELPTKASEAINESSMLLHKYLNGIDCLNDCAMKAIETCSADPPWMGRMLDIMVHHAGNQSLELYRLETLRQVLSQQLEELMEREKFEIEKTWGANPQHVIKQQQLKDSSTSALESLNQERKYVEAALLRVELLCMGLVL
ncbi:hypothetical protein SUGI_0742940 [Cryptomeria japonica]|uniref:uncharacterized protein LOC131065755 isoform X1 n=1 Tax=Cryptomeria japonica TaxID=3369 RepID=UPI002414B896|nr:uncharacterized protein LOC131065755 isoform X1 [Cryptomeria japonica]GLJ36826.1 hypothetical protein SUGI_0742940 [Cryptomeria japonica]